MNVDAFIDGFSGIVGAVSSVYVGQPLDTIKTKLQTFPNQYHNFFDCTLKIFAEAGIPGFYAGTIPSLVGNIAENGILFMAYGQCQRLICSLSNKTNNEQLTTFENMLAGSVGSVFSSLVLCPTELVKCRLQTLNDMPMSNTSNNSEAQKRKISSSLSVTRHILRTEGIRGLFRGLTATLARECPGNACFFGGYEFTRSILMRENEKKSDIGFFKTWIAGGMAGVCFWIVMYPVDVVKSRIQVFEPSLNFPKYTLEIIRNEGFMAMYAGLFPTLIRTFVATGTLFITYEQTRCLFYHVL
ncbi:unnamed protein product [Adineta steineri]|uniref:Mitochondrial ornithine transporter 1-like protein n=1 Tax=Adineta steineri TaxID=433720 RepID=A0A819KVH0_9BILA|nr:unnamed protein product [Adineta steineri]